MLPLTFWDCNCLCHLSTQQRFLLVQSSILALFYFDFSFTGEELEVRRKGYSAVQLPELAYHTIRKVPQGKRNAQLGTGRVGWHTANVDMLKLSWLQPAKTVLPVIFSNGCEWEWATETCSIFNPDCSFLFPSVHVFFFYHWNFLDHRNGSCNNSKLPQIILFSLQRTITAS